MNKIALILVVLASSLGCVTVKSSPSEVKVVIIPVPSSQNDGGIQEDSGTSNEDGSLVVETDTGIVQDDVGVQNDATPPPQEDGGTQADSAPLPYCALQTFAHYASPEAAQLKFAGSPTGTYLTSVKQGGFANIAHYYSSEGDALDWGSALPHATNPVLPVTFIVGTPYGYLASTWDNGPNTSTTDWLVRLGSTGTLLTEDQVAFNMDGAADDGTSADDGVWVADTFWNPTTGNATYAYGKVDNSATVNFAQQITLPNASCTILGGIARSQGTMAIGSSYFQGGIAYAGLLIQSGSGDPIQVKVVQSSGAVSPSTRCDQYYSVSRVYTIGNQFAILWRDNVANVPYLTLVDNNGTVASTIVLHWFIRDLMPIKGGFLAGARDPYNMWVGMLILDANGAEQYSQWFTLDTGVLNEGPFVATSGENIGRFGLSWIDGRRQHHVAFMGYNQMPCRQP